LLKNALYDDFKMRKRLDEASVLECFKSGGDSYIIFQMRHGHHHLT